VEKGLGSEGGGGKHELKEVHDWGLGRERIGKKIMVRARRLVSPIREGGGQRPAGYIRSVSP